MTEADRLAARSLLPGDYLCRGICASSPSVRTGIPFGWYYYTGSTEGQELYIADVPFMDSLSFPLAIASRWLLSCPP